MAEWIAPGPNTPTAQLLLPDSKGVRRRTAAFASHMPLFGAHFVEWRWLTYEIFGGAERHALGRREESLAGG